MCVGERTTTLLEIGYLQLRKILVAHLQSPESCIEIHNWFCQIELIESIY